MTDQVKVKSVGKPDAVAPHVRFDEAGAGNGVNLPPRLPLTLLAVPGWGFDVKTVVRIKRNPGTNQTKNRTRFIT